MRYEITANLYKITVKHRKKTVNLLLNKKGAPMELLDL